MGPGSSTIGPQGVHSGTAEGLQTLASQSCVTTSAFSTTDTTPVGGIPLDVLRICQWTWMCAPPPLGPDVHANTTGYCVIAHAFEDVLNP
jgi:hypothetical protein